MSRDVCHYLKYRGSVARTMTLRQAGFTDRDIRSAIAEGRIKRLRHGVLALHDANPEMVLAVLANGLLTCVSAAPYQGLWRLTVPDKPHLLCRHGAAKGVAIHRDSVWPGEDPLPIASMADTLLHALRCQPSLEAAVMVESAMQQGRTTLDYLRARLPGNRNGRARAVLDLVDGTKRLCRVEVRLQADHVPAG